MRLFEQEAQICLNWVDITNDPTLKHLMLWFLGSYSMLHVSRAVSCPWNNISSLCTWLTPAAWVRERKEGEVIHAKGFRTLKNVRHVCSAGNKWEEKSEFSSVSVFLPCYSRGLLPAHPLSLFLCFSLAVRTSECRAPTAWPLARSSLSVMTSLTAGRSGCSASIPERLWSLADVWPGTYCTQTRN